jgi:hypothetical protein
MPPPGNSFYDQVLSRVIAKLVLVTIELVVVVRYYLFRVLSIWSAIRKVPRGRLAGSATCRGQRTM